MDPGCCVKSSLQSCEAVKRKNKLANAVLHAIKIIQQQISRRLLKNTITPSPLIYILNAYNYIKTSLVNLR